MASTAAFGCSSPVPGPAGPCGPVLCRVPHGLSPYDNRHGTVTHPSAHDTGWAGSLSTSEEAVAATSPRAGGGGSSPSAGLGPVRREEGSGPAAPTGARRVAPSGPAAAPPVAARPGVGWRCRPCLGSRRGHRSSRRRPGGRRRPGRLPSTGRRRRCERRVIDCHRACCCSEGGRRHRRGDERGRGGELRRRGHGRGSLPPATLDRGDDDREQPQHHAETSQGESADDPRHDRGRHVLADRNGELAVTAGLDHHAVRTGLLDLDDRDLVPEKSPMV